MDPSRYLLLRIALGGLAFLFLVYWIDRMLRGTARVYLRYFVAALSVGAVFVGLGEVKIDADRALGVVKAMLAMLAAGFLFYEQHREGMQRPVSERWKKFVGVTLGVAAIVCYFHGFRFGFYKYYHRHDQYHYYMGAKYFPEIGYDDLYKCTAVAADQLGVIDFTDDAGRHGRIDLGKETQRPDRKIRDTGGNNLLVPAAPFLEHPEDCTSHFSPERWAAFKEDIKFFRVVADREFFEKMQSDHGYNPPPVWMLAGRFFADMHPAGQVIIGHEWLWWLAQVDNVLLAVMFTALWWAFGWRVFALAALFWGCNAPGDDWAVQGAFLRQDWLCFFVLAACFARKRWFGLSAASLVYAALLRIFPGLPVIAWLVVAGAHLVRHKRLAPHHKRMLLGGTLAAAILLPASVYVCGKGSYPAFYKHTLEGHDRTPLTNHMGLRVLISQGVGTGPSSGRAMYVTDNKLEDPFQVWQEMRNARYDKYKPVGWAIIALSLAFFAWSMRKVKSMWIALCVGQIFIILMSQLTSYYYAFLIITAPLTRVRRQIEVPYLGLAALTQIVFLSVGQWDDKSVICTLLSLAFCYWLVCLMAPRGSFDKLRAMVGLAPAGKAG